MSSQQITQNLVWFLNPTNFVWSAGQPVLGRVGVVVDPPTLNVLDQVTPSVLIRVERAAAHPEHPADLDEEVKWTITLYAQNGTDQAGGAAVVGGNRTGAGSQGRGVLEIEPLLRARIQQAFIACGVRPRIVSAPATVAEAIKGLLAARAYEVTATRLPVQATYLAPTRLAALNNGVALALYWTPPPLTWNLVALQVNRAAGSTPPATPTSGTVLTSTLSPTATGFANATTGNAYSVFGVYDDTVDPVTGLRDQTKPVSAYSGYQTPEGTFTYQPGTVTT